ncbi:MAG: rhodanese-like domain-containing protein [Haloferacaceae archaeon]
MSRIRPPELESRLESGEEPYVLDVRPEADYRAERIEGSHNVPVYGALRDGDDDALRRQLDGVPRDREVVTVCKAGIVARRATSVLREEGYDAVTLTGGMRGWTGYQNGSFRYRVLSALWRLVP